MKLTDITDNSSGWTVTLSNKRRAHIELRKEFPNGNLFIIVADDDGYDYKNYLSSEDKWGRSTKGIAVHISCNGPVQMTMDEFADMNNVVMNARGYLLLEKVPEAAK